MEKEIFDAGYMHKVEAKCPVLDFETKLEKEVVLAYSPDHFIADFGDGAAFTLNTSFGEAGTMSCGFIHLKKEGYKPNKNSGKHALVFSEYVFLGLLVITGVLEVVVHRSSFIVYAGCQFFVPRGNQYEIRNASKSKTASVFFCHCKV